MTRSLDEILADMRERRDELQGELNSLEAMLSAGTAEGPTIDPLVFAPQPKSKPKAKASRRRKPTGKKRGRPPGSGSRGPQALALLDKHGPLTILELAKHMGIKQNYLYRVMPALKAEGKVIMDAEKRWVLV